jgi:hypothetical protein
LYRAGGQGRLLAVPDDATADVPPELRMASLSRVYQRLAQDQATIVDFVAVKLAHTLPGAVDVKRRGLLGGGPIERVRVTVGDTLYELTVRRGTLEASRGGLVGGICLRHDPVSVDAWVRSLLEGLEHWAIGSDDAKAALEQLT